MPPIPKKKNTFKIENITSWSYNKMHAYFTERPKHKQRLIKPVSNKTNLNPFNSSNSNMAPNEQKRVPRDYNYIALWLIGFRRNSTWQSYISWKISLLACLCISVKTIYSSEKCLSRSNRSTEIWEMNERALFARQHYKILICFLLLETINVRNRL